MSEARPEAQNIAELGGNQRRGRWGVRCKTQEATHETKYGGIQRKRSQKYRRS